MTTAPSTTRFVLLMLVVCAGTTFATYWWLVAERGDWIGRQRACVHQLRHASPPGVLVSTYNGCMGGIALQQEGLVLAGAAAIAVAAVIVTGGGHHRRHLVHALGSGIRAGTERRLREPVWSMAAGPGGANAGLPDLPPSVTQGKGPISPGVGCLVLSDQARAEELEQPLDLEQLGAVLQRTPDQALDTIGAILVQAGTAPIDTIRAAWRAAAFRCFILNSS